MAKRQARPSLLVRTRFNENMDAVMYELVIADVHMIVAYNLRCLGSETDSPDEIAMCNEAAEQREAIARRYRAQGTGNLDALYGIGAEHMPFIDDQIQPLVEHWCNLGAAISELAKEVGRVEGLSEANAERRVVYTKPRWR